MEFRIKAFDAATGVLVYTVDALDEADARRLVAGQGHQLIAVAARRLGVWRRAGSVQLVQFSEELVALLDAGLPLVEAIEALTEKEASAGARRALQHVCARLYEGAPLSAALAELPSSFPELYVATVRASERSGAIREALVRYVAYQRQVDVLRKRLVSASIYPAVLCVAGLLVTLFLLGYVVPRFSSIYQDMGDGLPWASRLLMQWGRVLEGHGASVALAGLALAGLALHLVTRPATRARLATLVARLPAVGRQLHTYQLARIYRTLGMLLRGGVPAVAALQMSAGIVGAGRRAAYAAATQAIREGRGLAAAMEQHGLTTPVAVRMLRVGEHSGNMGEMMERLAAFYDDELARAIDILTRLIEPLLMTVIGLVIGLIVVLMYFPIFELAGSLQ
ncbi:MAG: type II secretion system F family protein [Steroidobacteraceae bacterium]